MHGTQIQEEAIVYWSNLEKKIRGDFGGQRDHARGTWNVELVTKKVGVHGPIRTSSSDTSDAVLQSFLARRTCLLQPLRKEEIHRHSAQISSAFFD